MIGFKSQEDFNRARRAIRHVENWMRESELRPIPSSITAQPVTFKIKGTVDENGFYEAVFLYRVNPETESTSTTSTSPIPTSTSSTSSTEEDRCSTTSTTTSEDPRWYEGEVCYIQQLNGRHLGEGCLHNGIVACYYLGYAFVVTGEEDPVGTVCAVQPTAPNQPCTGRCIWEWNHVSREWEKDDSDYLENGCCVVSGCQCDQPDFCPEVGVLCARVVTNCTSRNPIVSPNCKCVNCVNCYCTARVGTLVSGTLYNINSIACGTVQEDPLYRNVCLGCGGCPTDTTWDWGEAMEPGEFAYLQVDSLGIPCSGVIDGTTSTTTTGTSTTSTTTTFGNSCSGCNYRWIPGVGFIRTSFNCNGVECKRACAVPAEPEGPVCQDFHTSCLPNDPPPPPPPSCTGSCEWVSDGTKWIKLEYASRCYYPCSVGTCACEPPSEEAGPCSTNTFTPCKCPALNGDGPTTVFGFTTLPGGGSGTSSTSTTEKPCTTTTMSPDCNTGYCWWLWNSEDSYWYYSGRSCPDYCGCNSPVGEGQADCQIVKTPCGVETSTTTTTTTDTTTTTTSTTSTTTTVNCQSGWCHRTVEDCQSDTPSAPWIRLYLLSRCMTGFNSPPAVELADCNACLGDIDYIDIYNGDCSTWPIGAMYTKTFGCETTSTTSTSTTPVPCYCLAEGATDWNGGGCGVVYDTLRTDYGNGNCLWLRSFSIGCGRLGNNGNCSSCDAGQDSVSGCCCSVQITVADIVAGCDSSIEDRTFVGNCVSPTDPSFPCEWPEECNSVIPGSSTTTTTSTTSTTTTAGGGPSTGPPPP